MLNLLPRDRRRRSQSVFSESGASGHIDSEVVDSEGVAATASDVVECLEGISLLVLLRNIVTIEGVCPSALASSTIDSQVLNIIRARDSRVITVKL